MKRILSTRRLYSVSNYNNFTVEDTIELDLPTEKALSQELIDKVYYLQMISLDAQFLRYMKLKLKQGTMKLDEALSFLEEEKANSQTELEKELLNQELSK